MAASSSEKHHVGPYEESWEAQVAERILEMVHAKEKKNGADGGSSNRYPHCMMALCGIPGSGKSVSSIILASILEGHGVETMVMPHDGYHYPLEYLKTFPDAQDAIYRRGAPDTFDPQALFRDLLLIKGSKQTNNHVNHLISVPGFDHAKGDPEPNLHTFDRSKHKVVICEGLYLLHDCDGWQEVANVFDLKVFMEANVDDCINRLKIRNQVIPGYTREEIEVRCEKVDRTNAMTLMRSKHRADVIVESRSMPLHSSKEPEVATTDQQEMLAKLEHAADTIERFKSVSTLAMPPAANQSDTPPPPPASQIVGTWEPELAERISQEVDKLGSDATKFPYMVAIVGTPGSGKSVSSMLLASMLEKHGYPTMVCPHDGYHYPLAYLKTLSNADDFIYRRGAPDTFDSRALMRDLKRIKNGEEELIKLPAFDHAKADPEPDTHIFDRNHHRIVLCEGLYLLHDQDGWEEVASVFNLTIFMDSDVDVCIERVKIRNQCIPGYTVEEMEERCEKVDRVNALTVLRSKARADVVVESCAMKK